jgi:hypothetical protein
MLEPTESDTSTHSDEVSEEPTPEYGGEVTTVIPPPSIRLSHSGTFEKPGASCGTSNKLALEPLRQLNINTENPTLQSP